MPTSPKQTLRYKNNYVVYRSFAQPIRSSAQCSTRIWLTAIFQAPREFSKLDVVRERFRVYWRAGDVDGQAEV